MLALLIGTVWAATAPPDTARLAPAVRWLETERICGTLTHRPNVAPLEPQYLAPVPEGPSRFPGEPEGVVLRGQHFAVIEASRGESVRLRLETMTTQPTCPWTVWALFGPSGELVALGKVPDGKSEEIVQPAMTAGVYTLMLNPGVAEKNVARLTVRSPHWSLEARGRGSYAGTPLEYHTLRDYKLAGLNLVMLDFEGLDQEFVSEDGLRQWTEAVRKWGDYARKFRIRLMPAVDLGGTPYEVEAWGDSRPGLYPQVLEKQPLAPCPLDKTYWDRILLRRGRAVARLSRENEWIVGYGIDPEMYQCWGYGHYMLSGTCFCDHCVGGFMASRGADASAVLALKTGKERLEWLRAQGLYDDYDKYLEAETEKLAACCRDEMHKINPNLLISVYVLEIGNWFCRGLARGLGTEGVPVVDYAERTYNSGYGDGVQRMADAFANWGAHVVNAGALWDRFHPPTADGYLPAQMYNFAVRAGGYWFWPGQNVFEDQTQRTFHYGKPALQEDYWQAMKRANDEIAKRLTQGEAYVSPLDTIEQHPTWGPNSKPEDGIETKPWPFYPIHLAGPARLYLAVPKRCSGFQVYVQAEGEGNAAAARIRSPDGKVVAEASGEMEEEALLEAANPNAGATAVWTLEVGRVGDQPLRDVAVRLDGVPPYLCTSPSALLTAQEKAGDLVAWWRLDENSGIAAGDNSGPPPLSGTVHGARWTAGRHGSALLFEQNGDAVLVRHNYNLDSLREFTLQAWVKLSAMPVPGNGNTIVNKGPEAPVQHAWWWMGYPPGYPLILEMGSAGHQWGIGLSSDPLQWELGRWYRVTVALRCDGQQSVARHYRDGEFVGENAAPEVLHSGSYDLKIGDYGDMHTFKGAIDEVKVWSRALTDEEIKASYEQEARE
jgi:hypothetical protein